MSNYRARPSTEGRHLTPSAGSLIIVALAALALWPGMAVAGNSQLLRYPDIHGDLIAFVYASDIWTVPADGGIARRVTSHPGRESFPKFSPDGQWLAFTGQYDGDEQVYVMLSTGGVPKRLTSYPAWGPLAARWGSDNQVVGWTPDGQSVVFRSHRDQHSIVDSRLYTVSIQGGLPQALPMPRAGAGVFSPDGRRILYSPQARDFRTWKNYRGGWAHELWISELDGEASNLSNYEGSDRDPIWNSLGIFFVSDRNGRLNLYAAGEDGKAISQLTHHDDDVRWASGDISGNIVYELHGSLRVYSSVGQDRLVEVHVPDDAVHSRSRSVDVSDRIEDFDLSPNGTRIALTARGDVFTIPVGEGVTRNLTHSDTHERLAAWSPDGTTVAYVSDASGEEELWFSDDGAQTATRQITSGNQRRVYRIAWSPSGDRIAAGDHMGQIHVIDIASGRSDVIGETGAWYMQDFSWSPDGSYLAFSSLEPTFLSSIFVWSEDDGVVRLSSALANEYSPAWDESGDYLYFLADRSFAPQIGSFEWNYVVDRETSVRGIALRADLPNPVAPNANLSSKKATPRKIQFEGIESRVFRVPVESGNFDILRMSGDELLLIRSGPFYLGRDSDIRPELLAYSLAEKELRVIATDVLGEIISQDVLGALGRVEPAADLPKVLVKENTGGLKVYDVESGEPETVEVGGLRKRIDPKQEWRTVFDETWRRFRDFFYVSNMHGYDWEAIGAKYRELLPYVSHRSDLNYLIGEMIAELNVGHAYVFGGDFVVPERPVSALLGATFEPDSRAGRYRIGKVYRGDNSDDLYRSPLREVGVGVSAGEYILSINGIELTVEQNPYELLGGHGGRTLELQVSPTPNGSDARSVLIEPVASEQALIYYEWVENNRVTVEKLSGGRIGYLHVPSMGPAGIREFIRMYYGQIRKDGLIVDVRGNTGGNVSQMILERLFRRPYSLGYVQNEKPVRVYPWGVGGARVFSGEVAVIANENTLSDGEAFTWTFQKAARGPVIGKRTWGGVIGIDDTGATVDGGGMRVPQFAMANAAGEWVVEGTGVIPDIEVSNWPSDALVGRDRQLETAVDEILRILGDRTPGQLPGPKPAPDKTQR